MIIKPYHPRIAQQNILNSAMAHINSVPYKVTLRWLFYRLYQDGLYHTKKEYKDFIGLQAKARKSFYDGWLPDTLADDTREVIIQGDGWQNDVDWLKAVAVAEYKETVWLNQESYVEVWFEAAAMAAQFKYYIKDIPLFTFHGDCSIAPKWEAAKRLEQAYEDYHLPITIIYFGDDDKKGKTIPYSAIKDIHNWCSAPFEFVRGGLNTGDGKRLNLPESIDKEGEYQWEALSDTQASEMILPVVNTYFSIDAADETHTSEQLTTRKYNDKMQKFIKDW